MNSKAKVKSSKKRKVALAVEAIRGHERNIMLGIAKYARTSGNWVFYLDKLDPYYHYNPVKIRYYIAKLLDWGVDGIITRYPDKFQDLSDKGIPIFSLKQSTIIKNKVLIDNKEIGAMGARYFIEQGFKFFGFCGFEKMFWSDIRCEAFCQKISEYGYGVSIYQPLRSHKSFSWDLEQKSLAEWLASLPKPVAVMTCNDDCAEHVLEVAKISGYYVPENISVLGVGNDELICEFSDPSLSSIGLNSFQAGYEIASVLDQLMNCDKIPCSTVCVKPLKVICRRSTDFLAVEDETVSKVIAFVRKNSDTIIQVEEIAEHVEMSLRSLQSHFLNVMGFSLREELKRARLNHIMNLLLDFNLNIDEIASMTGYTTTYNMIRFFKSETGVSPGKYRKLNYKT